MDQAHILGPENARLPRATFHPTTRQGHKALRVAAGQRDIRAGLASETYTENPGFEPFEVLVDCAPKIHRCPRRIDSAFGHSSPLLGCNLVMQRGPIGSANSAIFHALGLSTPCRYRPVVPPDPTAQQNPSDLAAGCVPRFRASGFQYCA